MRRWAATGFLLAVLGFLAMPLAAFADNAPFITVVDSVLPATPGLSITGGSGGCDLLLQNQTNKSVTLYDTGTPPKAFPFPATPVAKGTARPPLAIHLFGAWPCASLPAVTEDERWNNQPESVLFWSLRGQVGSVSFVVRAHTEYQPALDPSAQSTTDLRMVAGALVVGGIVLGLPYLLVRRRRLLTLAP